MAGKRIEVQLGINADVAAAKKSIKDLETSLNKLYDKQKEHNFGNYGLNEAVAGAQKLEQALNRALNVQTGKLDLSKFSNELKNAGTSLQQLNTQLLNVGPAGQQVFLSLANSIAQAEIPLKKTSRLVQEFSRTLKNTVSYQLSATMFNAVTGALHDAVSYTKNLNGSLNEIRIVTGQSADQMAKFAQSANAAAKQLSTTTNNYAKASLIFYQQGLSDADVKKRTDAVIKMANVTKESADDVSSYMTAIWNNFDDGSKSLERYADVMTALGAATASSTKEIAAGLEKFASIGKTIGLSYEYATSAVATIVDKTRQSADTVGTGLRTIFSRLQGLSLGETLEDGVDLNKYSAALKTVGVNILDASGNMQDMDAILESLADKWQNLSTAQKTALAQTVGGVRQYTTLISLMDNWDSMERNLNTANTSAGSLQKQQDIYAESWEAASERSKAALEGLYQTLLNDKGFIKLIDGLTGVTNVVTHLAKALGGLPGILGTVGMIATKVFSNQIQSGIEQSLSKLSTWTSQFKDKGFKQTIKEIGSGQSKSAEQVKAIREAEKAQKEYSSRMTQMEATGKTDTSAYKAASYANDLLSSKQALLNVEHQLSDAQKQNAQDQITLMGKQQQALLELKQEKEQMIKDEKRQKISDVKSVLGAVSNMDAGGYVRTADEQAQYILNNKTASVNSLYAMRSQAESAAYTKSMAAQFRGYAQTLDPNDATAMAQLREGINSVLGANTVTTDDAIQEIIDKMVTLEQQADQTEAAIDDVIKKSNAGAQADLDLLKDSGSEAGTRRGSIDFEEWQRTGQYNKTKSQFSQKIDPAQGGGKADWGKKIAAGATTALAAVSALSAGLSQTQNAIDTIGDSGASMGDKIAAGASVATGAMSAFASGGWVGLAAYAVGAIASASQTWIENMNHLEEKEADKAEESATKLQENYKRIRAEYDNTMETVSSYESASESLDNLVVGTDEWKNALLDANEAALKLIKNFNLLEGSDYTIGSNGEIVLTKAGNKKVQEGQTQQLNDAIAAQNAADVAQSEAQIKRMKAQQDIAVRENNEMEFNALATAGAGAALGAAVGSIIPGIGTAIGAALGVLIGGIAGAVTAIAHEKIADNMDDAEKAKIDKIVAEYQKANGLMTDAELQKLIGTEFVGASESFKSSIFDIVKSTVEANNQLEQSLKRAGANVVTSNEIYQSVKDEEVRQDLIGRGQQVYVEKYAENKTTYESDLEDETKRQQYANAYLASLGLTDATIKDGSVKDDGSFTYTYLDENNQRQTAEATADMVSQYIISDWTSSQVNKEVGQWANVFADLRNGSDSDRALAAFGGKGLRTATKEEYDTLMTDYKSYFSELSTDELAALGYESAEQAIAAFEEQVGGDHGLNKAWQQAISGLSEIDYSLISQMSLDTAQSFTNAIEEMRDGPLKNVGQILNDGITQAFNEAHVKEEDKSSLLAQIAQIDWSDYDAFDQFVAIFESMGYSIDEASEYWSDFTGNMRKAGLAIPDFTKLKSNLNSIAKITKDLKLGDIVSEEDYQTLIDYNAAWKDLFVLQADGSRKFIGDAEAMQEATKQMALDQKELLDNYRVVSEIEDVQNFNWFDTSGKGSVQSDFMAIYDANEALQEMLTTAGYTREEIVKIFEAAANGDTAALQLLFGFIQDATDPAQLQQANIELEQMIASTAETVEKLQALRELGADNGGISDDTYQKSLIAMASGYEYCATAIENYQEALASGDEAAIESAEIALEAAVTAEQAAEKYNNMYTNALSGKSSMTVADLKLLQETNEELYNSYLTMSETDWYDASYKAYSAFLNERIAGCDKESAEYKALIMEKQALDEEYYETVEDRAKEAYDSVFDTWEKQKTEIDDAMSALSIFDDGKSFASQTAADILKLEIALLNMGKTAEEVDEILRNLGKDESKDDYETQLALIETKANLLLDKFSGAQQLEADLGFEVSEADVQINAVFNPESAFDTSSTDGVKIKVGPPDDAVLVSAGASPGDGLRFSDDKTMIYLNYGTDPNGVTLYVPAAVAEGTEANLKTVFTYQNGKWYIMTGDDPEPIEVGATSNLTNFEQAYFHFDEGTKTWQMRFKSGGAWYVTGYTQVGFDALLATGENQIFTREDDGSFKLSFTGQEGAQYSVTLTMDQFLAEVEKLSKGNSALKYDKGKFYVEFDHEGTKIKVELDPNIYVTGENSLLGIEGNQIVYNGEPISVKAQVAFEEGIQYRPELVEEGSEFTNLIAYRINSEGEEEVLPDFSYMNLTKGEATLLTAYLQGTGITVDIIPTINAVEGAENLAILGTPDVSGNFHSIWHIQTIIDGDNPEEYDSTEYNSAHRYGGWVPSETTTFNEFRAQARSGVRVSGGEAGGTTVNYGQGPYAIPGEVVIQESYENWSRFINGIIEDIASDSEEIANQGLIQMQIVGEEMGSAFNDAMDIGVDSLDFQKVKTNLHTTLSEIVSYVDDFEVSKDNNWWDNLLNKGIKNATIDEQAAINFVGGFFDSIKDDPTLINQIPQLFDFVDDGIISQSEEMGYFLAQGLLAMASSTLGEDSQIVQSLQALLATMRLTLGIASPSKITMEMGMWLAKGLEQGLNNTEVDVSPFVQKVLTSLKKGFENGSTDLPLIRAMQQLTLSEGASWDTGDFYGSKNQALLGEEYGYYIRENEGNYEVVDSQGAKIIDQSFDNYNDAFSSAIGAAYSEKAFKKYFDRAADPEDGWLNYQEDDALTAVHKGLMSSVLEGAVELYKEANPNSTVTVDTFLDTVPFDTAMEYMNQSYENSQLKVVQETEATIAEINDLWTGAVDVLVAKEAAGAEKTYKKWVDTFNMIAAARKAILENESFIEALDDDQVTQLIDQYIGEGKDTASIRSALLSNQSDRTVPNFKIDNYNAANQRTGIDQYLSYDSSNYVTSAGLIKDAEGNYITDPTHPMAATNPAALAGARSYQAMETALRADVNTLFTNATEHLGGWDEVLPMMSTFGANYLAGEYGTGEEFDPNAMATAIIEATRDESGEATLTMDEALAFASTATQYEYDENGQLVGPFATQDELVDAYIEKYYPDLPQAYQDSVIRRIQSDATHIDTMVDNLNQIGTAQLTQQQSDLDLLKKARTALDDGESLYDTDIISLEERDRLLELTGAADLSAISMGTLDGAVNTLTNSMLTAAQQISTIIAMLFSGQADSWGIDEDGNYVAYKTETAAGNQGEGWTYDETTDTSTRQTEVNLNAPNAATQAMMPTAAEYVDESITSGLQVKDQEMADALSAAAEKAGMSLGDLEAYADSLEKTGDMASMSREELLLYAADVARFEKGLKKAASSMDKWNKTLEEGTDSEKRETLEDIRDAYADIFDLSGGQAKKLSKGFLESAEALELLELVATDAGEAGQEALDKLQAMAAEDLLQGYETGSLKFGQDVKDLIDDISNLEDVMGIEAGDIITGTDEAYSTLNNFWSNVVTDAMNAGHSFEEATEIANAAMNALGYDVEPMEFEEVEMDAEGLKKQVTSSPIPVTVLGPDGMPMTVTIDNVDEIISTGEGTTYKVQIPKGKNSGGSSPTFTKRSEKTGGGGSGGGGGGGGGGRSRDPRRANHVKKADYVERYHEIDNTIDDLADAYERLNKEEDRAWGKNRIDAMKEQTKVIKDQIAATEEKIRQAKEYLEGYYDTNGKWVKGDRQTAEDMGWEFDADGNVSNYDEFMEDQVNKYNAAIDAYNGMSAEAQEELDKKYQDMKNDDGEFYSGYEDYLKQTLLDDPKEALEQYEETMELLEDLGMDYDDLLNEWHDNIIGQIQTKLDTTLEVTEAQLGYLEHKLSRIEDDAYSAAEAIGLMGQQMDIAQTQFNAHKSALDDLLKAYSPEGTVWSAEDLMNGNISSEDLVNAGMQSGDIELIQTIMEGMMDASEQMSEQMVNSIEHMANAFEEFNADMDRYISTVEHAQAITSTYRNIIDLTGRTMSGFNSTMLKSINDAIAAQSIAKLEANKTKYETVKTEYDEAKAAYEAAQQSYAEGGIDAAALKAAKDTYQAAQDNMNDAQEAFLSSWEEALQAAADAFQSNMEAAVRDIGEMMSGGLAGGLAELEDAFAKMNERDQNYVDDYEKIYQLTKMTRDLTDKIDSTSNIRAQKELLKYQKELNGLLESDQEMSAYDLDYLQKKLDLKLAEIALDEAQNAKSQVTMRRDSEGNYNYVYTADENAVEKAESDYADRLYEMQKANDEYITGLSENMANLSSQMLSEIAAIDTTIYDTEEKYQAEVQRITDHYTSQMEYYNSEMNKVLGNNKTLYEQDWTNFSKYTGYKLSAEENYVTKWNQTVLSQVTGFETQEEFYQNFNEAVFGGDPAHPSGESLIGRLVTAYKTMRDQIAAANAAAGVETEDLATALLGNIEAATQEAEAAADGITEAATEIVTQITSIGDAVTNMVNNYSQAMATMEAETDAMLGVLLDFLTAYGAVGDLEIDEGVLAEINRRRQERQENPEGYDTGGYTGAWGSEGRLAYLHQKELVLNAEDTANMLASVGILRQIANVIDLNALASAGGFISLMSSGVAGNQGTLQQEVHIEASFPAVTDKNQIEEAFGDLVNLAAQYANRKL